MQLNPFKIKRQIAVVLIVSITSVASYFGLVFMGMIGGLTAMLVSMIICTPICLALTANPYTPVVEGKGILALDMNSTGMIQPFTMQVNTPQITGRYKDKEIKAHFDRDIVSTIGDPITLKESKVYNHEGNIIIFLRKEDYMKARFSMTGQPTIIFNSLTGTFYTKENLQKMEKTTLSLHSMLLYAIEQGEAIKTYLKGFEKYTINLLNKNKSGNFWLIVIILVLIGAGIILFMPQITKGLQGLIK